MRYFAILAFLVLLGFSGLAFADCVELSDNSTYQGNVSGSVASGFTVNGSITLCSGGNYYFSGVTALTVNTPYVAIDCNGAWISGNNSVVYGVYSNMAGTNISNCNIRNFTTGIYYSSVNDGNIVNTTANSTHSYSFSSTNGRGIYICGSGNSVIDSTATSSYGIGIDLRCGSGNMIINSAARANSYYAVYTSGTNSIIGSNLTAGSGMGIYVASSGAQLANSTFTTFGGDSIYLESVSNTQITNCTANSTNGNGAFLYRGSNNVIVNSRILSQDGAAMVFSGSTNNQVSNSTVSSVNDLDFDLSISSIADCENTLTNVTNENGKPILYYTGTPADISGVDASEIILCDASYSRVADSNASVIWMYYSNYSNLTEVSANSDSESGLGLSSSSENRIINSTFASSDMIAAWMYSAYGNLVFNSTFISSPNYGLYLSSSANNTFLGNLIRAPQWVYEEDGENAFNDSSSGNRYYFSDGTGAWEVYDVFDTDADGWADSGSDRPFNASLSGGVWGGTGEDWHPYTENTEESEPYIGCVNLSDSSTYQGNVSGSLASGFSVNGSITLCEGEYAFTAWPALTINAEDVAIDCSGSSITEEGGVGVYDYTYGNPSVRNCTFDGFAIAVSYSEAPNGRVSDVVASGPEAEGGMINIYGSDNATLSNLEIYSEGIGMYVDSSDDLHATGLDVSGSWGIYHARSSGGIYMLSNVTSEGDGFDIYNSPSTEVYQSRLETTGNGYSALFLADDGEEMRTDNCIFTGNTFIAEGNSAMAVAISGELNDNDTFLGNTLYSDLWFYGDYASEEENYFNDSFMGNRYYFANGTGSWEVYDIVDTDGDNWADEGSDLPFNASLAGSNWYGYGADWHPYTENVEESGGSSSSGSSRESLDWDWGFDCESGKLTATASEEENGIAVRLLSTSGYVMQEESTDSSGEAAFTVTADGSYKIYQPSTSQYLSYTSATFELALCGEQPIPEENATQEESAGTEEVQPPAEEPAPPEEIAPPEGPTQDDASSAIDDAFSAISDAANSGKDTSGAQAKLDGANAAFAAGNFEEAIRLAEEAKLLALNSAATPSQETGANVEVAKAALPAAETGNSGGFPWWLLALALLAIGIAAYFIMKNKGTAPKK